MLYSLNLDFNYFHPYSLNTFCININEDYRFKKSSIAEKIIIKAKDDGYKSIVEFDTKTNLIKTEKRILTNGDAYEATFYYNKENLKLEQVIIKNSTTKETLEKIEVEYSSKKIKIRKKYFYVEYELVHNKIDTVTIFDKKFDCIDCMLKFSYNELNKIVKVEEYSQFENNENDEINILDNPKLLFITNIKEQLNSNILEIEYNVEDLTDKTTEKKVYKFNQFGLIISENFYSKTKDSINSQILYEYEFNSSNDWVKKTAKRKHLLIDTKETCKIIEREII